MTIDKRFMLILMAAVLAGACGVAQAQDNGNDTATGGAVIGNGDSAAPDAATDDNTASADPNDDGVGNDKPSGPFGNPQNFLFIMIGFLVLMYFFSSRTRKKHAAKRREMLNALSKGDKITTIGGIVGTVVEIKDKEVLVRVDESNNIKIRFITSAVSRVGETSVPDEGQKKK